MTLPLLLVLSLPQASTVATAAALLAAALGGSTASSSTSSTSSASSITMTLQVRKLGWVAYDVEAAC
jgi:ABC-type glycerol-3-phosphate transport system substrate-binding protein